MTERLAKWLTVKLRNPSISHWSRKGFAWMSTLKTISALHTISKCRPPIPEICRKRSRYYQGTVDLNMISSGAGYDELKTSYIIFINTFDLFGKGFPKYTFENICQESSDLHLDDGTVKVFINAKSTIPGMSRTARLSPLPLRRKSGYTAHRSNSERGR